MADFRKLSFVLAALALVAVLTVPAQAQPAVSCTASPGQNVPLIRDGGLTELVGDVLLNCSPTVAGATTSTNVNFQIFMNTTVTNRINSSMQTTASLVYTNAAGAEVLVIGILQPTLPTDTPSLRNSILFPNVALPNGTVSTVRITNVRVVAPPANPPGALPAGVVEQISASPAGTVPIANAFQTVAYVLTPVQFSVTKCGSSTALTALAYVQCVDQPTSGVSFAVHYKEAFATAFKAKSLPNAGGVEDGNNGGIVGHLRTDAVPGNPDLADTGTRLMLTFTNIPTGVTVLVGEYPNGTTSVATATARMAIGAKSDGTGGTLATDTSPTATCSGATVLHAIESGGYAVWEVMSSTLDTDELVFAVEFQWTAQPGLGKPGLTGANPITVSGQLAPVSSVAQADSTSPIPRFANRPLAGGIQVTISPCVTNLLFPWVTNVGNFDTSLVVSNTSADPFGTGTQSGKCTFYYFNGGPLGTGGLSTPPATQPQPQTTTATVAAGSYVVSNMLYNGGLQGDANPIAAGSFSGYVIAVCNFQFAHGFAYITDRNAGSSTGSAGYTALVIPDWSITTGSKARQASESSWAGQNTGESLSQ